MPRVRIELTTFRLLWSLCDYETDALPTALPRHMAPLPIPMRLYSYIATTAPLARLQSTEFSRFFCKLSWNYQHCVNFAHAPSISNLTLVC